jgi:subtilase family serine protease
MFQVRNTLRRVVAISPLIVGLLLTQANEATTRRTRTTVRHRVGGISVTALAALAVATAAVGPAAAAEPQIRPGVASGSAVSSTSAAHAHSKAICPAKSGQARCHAEVLTDNHGRPLVFNAPFATPADAFGSVGYYPQQLHSAYQLPWSSTVRQTIGIVDAYDHATVKADLDVFDAQFGLGSFPSCSATVITACFQRVDQNGNVRGFTNSDPNAAANWNLETNLDVQAAHATCLNCKILLVEAFSSGNGDFATAEDTAARLGATEISNSYELAEGKLNSWDPTSFNHAGIAIVASAGDHGYGPVYPADLNTIVAVGGTRLVLNSNGSYNSESVWGDGANAPTGHGTGSGCSTLASAYTTAAWWQKGVPNWQYTGCGAQRSVADVAALADPTTGFWVYTSATAWQIVGGTSLSAPVIAGVFALAGHPTSYTWPAQGLYQHLSQFHDVTTGSNGTCTYTIMCHGWAGYDGPTGVGTPWGIGGF